MIANADVQELSATLNRLVPQLRRLAELLIAQRQAVADCDLQRLLALTAEQEETGARVAQLETRRQRLQGALEAALGVEGLRAIADRCPDAAERVRLVELIEQVRGAVTILQRENERSAALLNSAIDVARRTRAYLGRLTGAQLAYGPPTGPRPAPGCQPT